MNTDYLSLDGWYENYDYKKWFLRVNQEAREGKKPGQIEFLCRHGKVGAPPIQRVGPLDVYCNDMECWKEEVPSPGEIARIHGIPLTQPPGVPTERYD